MRTPNDLFLAAEAIAEDRGYDAAIEELWELHRVTPYVKERRRNTILYVIGKMRKRRADHEFYQQNQSQEAANA